MAQRTVYLIKHLARAYNDECTVPHCADVVRAYARRDEAERQRFLLELEGGGDYDGGGCTSSLKLADGDSEEALLQRFGISAPPLTDYDERHWNNVPWHRQVLEQICNINRELLGRRVKF